MSDTSWIDEIEALLAASTPEPWEASVWERHVFVSGGPDNDDIAEFNFADEHTVKITRDQAVAHSKLFAAIPQIVVELQVMRGSLSGVMAQAENDLASAHAQICKLQSLDPETQRWPDWSPQANTLRWFGMIRQRFSLYEHSEERCPGHVGEKHDPKICARCGTHVDSLRPDTGDAP